MRIIIRIIVFIIGGTLRMRVYGMSDNNINKVLVIRGIIIPMILIRVHVCGVVCVCCVCMW